MTEKLENLLKDAELRAQLEQADDATLEKLLEEHGIDIKAEIMNAEQEEGELDLDALDNVAGGAKHTAGYWLRRIIMGKNAADNYDKMWKDAKKGLSWMYGSK